MFAMGRNRPARTHTAGGAKRTPGTGGAVASAIAKPAHRVVPEQIALARAAGCSGPGCAGPEDDDRGWLKPGSPPWQLRAALGVAGMSGEWRVLGEREPLTLEREDRSLTLAGAQALSRREREDAAPEHPRPLGC